MGDSLFVDKNGIVYCTSFEDGRIEKILLKKTGDIVFVCEECESTWTDPESIFMKNDFIGFMDYIESIGLIERGKAPDWDNIISNLGYVYINDVKDFVDKHGVEIVRV